MGTAATEGLKTLLNLLGATLSAAESATGGNVQSYLTCEPGSSEFFRGGVTAYHIRSKVDVLGVGWEHAHEVDCVSQQVAKEMAAGARKLFDTDISVSVTGYASPAPEHGVEVPFVWVALNIFGETREEKFVGVLAPHEDPGDIRVENQESFAYEAVEFLVWTIRCLAEERDGQCPPALRPLQTFDFKTIPYFNVL